MTRNKKKEVNLIPMNKQPPEVRRELGHKGGIKSAQVRKTKRAMADVLSQMINSPLPIEKGNAIEALREMGIDGEEATNGALLNMQLLNLALSNQVDDKTKLRAIELIHKFVDGQKLDVTTNGKEINQAPLLIEVIDKREQVESDEDD